MDDNNTTLTACAVTDDCTMPVAVSTFSRLRNSRIWRCQASDFGKYKNIQSISEQNALFSNLVQQSNTLLDELSTWFTAIAEPVRNGEKLEDKILTGSPPDTLFNGVVASPNKLCQAARSTRRSFVANQTTSRRIENDTNHIKQLSSRIS